MTARGSPFLIAWLVFSALIALPASARGQSTDQTANQSTIFPSLSAKAKRDAVVWPEPDVKQTSPTRKTIFEQPETAAGVPLAQPVPPAGAIGTPAMLAAPSATGAPGSLAAPADSSQQTMPGDECCPQCGRPLDHPILGSCNTCGPVRRLLCMLNPAQIFAAHPPGSPVYHEPWINRPFSVGLFVGPIVGSPLINDWIGQQTGTLAGMRFGWDLDDDYGLELRLATANIPIYDTQAAFAAQLASTGGGLPIPFQAGTRNADQFICDVDFLYYPWGDAHFRPYLLFGVGTDRIKFTDRMGTNYARILLGMPVGLGFKYHLNDWLIFRVECTDNIALAGGSIFQTQQNFSATGAFEVRLGRTKMQYWPWNPGR
jgi:hypothetical protein